MQKKHGKKISKIDNKKQNIVGIKRKSINHDGCTIKDLYYDNKFYVPRLIKSVEDFL